MKKFVTVHFVLRLAPLAQLVVLMIIDTLLYDAEGRFFRICCYLSASAALYLVNPLTREEPSKSAWFCGWMSGYYILSCIVGSVGDLYVPLFLVTSALFVMVFLSVTIRDKYREPATLFRKDAAWCCAEEDSRVFYSMALMTSIMVLVFMHSVLSDDTPFFMMGLALLLLDIQLHRKAYTGRTMLITHKKERKIQSIIMSGKGGNDIVPEVENSILTKVFRRVEQFMRDRKPYLDDRLSLEQTANILRLNKVYISRAINKFTDKNFRQYVNWHRVLYSVELMKEDPWLKVIEVAFMSGFHSQVTYNMAFKMFMEETPSDMMMRLRLQKPKPDLPESSRIQVRLPQKIKIPSSQDVRN